MSWPAHKKYALALTHDVDYPEMIKLVEIIRKPQKAWDILTGNENFWKFTEIVTLEKSYGLKSAFYFCGLKGNLVRYLLKAPDPFYDVRKEKYRQLMRFLMQEGFEVGMHASYLAYRSEEGFRAEKQRVEEALGGPVYGNRHHYYNMNPVNPCETALIQSRIGLVYDSSVNFRSRGFIPDACLPFHFYDPTHKRPIPLLELPVTLNDEQLFRYKKYDYRTEIDALLDLVRDTGGIFVANYHERFLNDTFYPEWRKSYEYLLKRITEKNDFYCDTPLNIAKYWLEKEKK